MLKIATKSLKRIITMSFVFSFFITTAQEYEGLDLHAEVTHVQPMTGIVFWTDNWTALQNLGDKTQLEFSYLIFSDVVEEEGVYDWSVVDNLLSQTASNGRQAILRFRYTYPGETNRSVPNYIVNSSGYNNRTANVEGKTTFIPDWSSTLLQDFTKEFFTKFAERYDNDARLAFVQVGFGSYAEYHLYDGPTGLGDYFPSKTYQTEFLIHVNNVLEHTKWSLSIDAASSEYSPIPTNANLVNLSYGLFDDSFLHSTHSESDTEYNRASWLLFGEHRAATNVAGGELNYYTTNDQVNALSLPNGPNGTPFEALATLYDITYMIGNDQYDYQTTARIEEASLHTGCHFEVTEFKTNGVLTSVTIKNNGIAPIYYDAYPTVNNVRSQESLKGLISGVSKSFFINTVATDESLSIECDRLVTGQEIQFDADLDENSTLHTTDNEVVHNFVVAYPNPFNDTIMIDTRNNGSVNVFIYDLVGKLILKSINFNASILNTSLLKKGVYVVKITANKNETTRVFIKK